MTPGAFDVNFFLNFTGITERDMDFRKYHGTGNDFVILEGLFTDLPVPREDVTLLCDRRTGIGADGLILAAHPSSSGDLAMRMFNPDGSEAEMCGNGIRCLAKYAYEVLGIRKEEILVETLAGPRLVRPLTGPGGEVDEVEVDMGAPDLASQSLPPPEAREEDGSTVLQFEGYCVRGYGISMGNPHFVIFVEDVAEAPVRERGPSIEKHPYFPERTNVEFVQVIDRERLRIRVWERGAGETMACGTGACASFAAALHQGRVAGEVEAHLPGGVLHLRVDAFGHVLMRGPVVEVFRGTLHPRWKGTG